MNRGRSPLFSVIYWSGVALLSVAFCEFTLWCYDFRPTYVLKATGIDGPLKELPFKLDPTRLYRLVPNRKKGINTAGYRDVEFLEETAKQRIVVIGDSIPMGLAVEATETFPKLLEQGNLDTEALNMGVQGYGPDQELLVLKEDAIPLRPNKIFWMIYPANDLNDLSKNRIFSLTTNGALVENPDNPIRKILPPFRLESLVRFVTSGRFLPAADEHGLDALLFQDKNGDEQDSKSPPPWDLLKAILKDGGKACSDRSIPLVIVVLPPYDDIIGANRTASNRFNDEHQVIHLAQELGIKSVDLSEPFSKFNGDALYSEKDRHLSAAGHKLVANLLEISDQQ